MKHAAAGSEQRVSCHITAKGTVQGVGFRPFVYRIALENNICGSVSNTSSGVKIYATGQPGDLEKFLHKLRENPPPLAIIDCIDIQETIPTAASDFSIIDSEKTATKEVILPPDVTICRDCEQELFDADNRRYHYALNNCTNCGPRYTIIRSLPYDRPATAMDPFPLCDACLKEYQNPADRRFHAEATSCPTCGPKIKITAVDGNEIMTEAPLPWLAEKIKAGSIIAVQGVGGFHIICDAFNCEAVQKLRLKKKRPAKPFAVLVKDAEMAQNCGRFNELGWSLIQSPQRPIVIVPDRGVCSSEVTGGLGRIGLFLPYTPLHQLLFHYLDRPIIATSANIADEPIIIDSATLRERLGSVVEFVLEFNREIINGCDDSVVAVAGETSIMMRRARGYAPSNFKLPAKLQARVLAAGADQKNTLGLGNNDQAILSPHIGDLQTLAAQQYYEKTVASFSGLYDFKPELIICDKHPNYRSTSWAMEQGVPVYSVQHHYAHALSGMVASGMGMDAEILSICWDGTGYGDDGTIWGGEFLECSYHNYKRVAHLKPFQLLGGEKAVTEPRRVALSLLFDTLGTEALTMENPCVTEWDPDELELLWKIHEKKLNTPMSSSIGRLFDAAASLLGISQVLSYEGESGLLMEKYYDPSLNLCYRFELKDGVIDCSAALLELAHERNPVRGVSGFINMLVEIIFTVMRTGGYREALLAGGVFQNARLVERLFATAKTAGYRFYLPSTIPCNDGGIALGQLAYALGHTR